MRSATTLACLLLVLVCVPVCAQDGDDGKTDKKDKKEEPKRKVDKTSPEAQALEELLSVPANYGKDDKRVELEYRFDGSGGGDDFDVRGFDKSGLGVGGGEGFFLGVGSRRQGMMLHALALKDDYEVQWELKVGAIAADSQLVFVFANGKSGGILGPHFAKRTKRGYKPVKKTRKLDRSHVTHDVMKVKYRVEDGVITCWINGRKFKETKKLNGKLDGRIGIFCSNVNVWVSRLTVTGAIDASKR